jgi:biopolymer transport protein ExbD
MVTTIFKLEDGLVVEMPKAEAAVSVPRERVSHIWIDRVGNISINDKLVAVDQIESIIYSKLVLNPALIVAFNTDKQTPFDVVNLVMEELKASNATRVSFTADFEKSGG